MVPPETGLKAGMESDSARLEATERLGEEPARRAASNSSCSSGTQSESGVKVLL